MESLDAIGLRTGTDKSSLFHNYLVFYEELFGHLRDQPIKILEIGVLRGESIAMWLEAFPQATVYGIDKDLGPNKTASHPRLQLLQLDCSLGKSLIEEFGKREGPFDFVVDDALHDLPVTSNTVEALFPRYIKPGGWFVIEDIYSGWNYKKKPHGIVKPRNDRNFNYCRSMVDHMNRSRWLGKEIEMFPEVSEFDREMRQVIYRTSVCAIQRKP